MGKIEIKNNPEKEITLYSSSLTTRILGILFFIAGLWFAILTLGSYFVSGFDLFTGVIFVMTLFFFLVFGLSLKKGTPFPMLTVSFNGINCLQTGALLWDDVKDISLTPITVQGFYGALNDGLIQITLHSGKTYTFDPKAFPVRQKVIFEILKIFRSKNQNAPNEAKKLVTADDRYGFMVILAIIFMIWVLVPTLHFFAKLSS